jgi:signal peptidase I
MIHEAHLHEACCDLVADIAREKGKVKIKVAGTSMVPTIWPGDLVMVGRCEVAELKPGSIVMFRRNRGLVVHRVLSRTGKLIVTRGDAKRCVDEPVNVSDIVGEVESIVRNGRLLNPRGTIGTRAVAFLLRRSEGCAKLYLRFGFKLRGMSLVPIA